MTPKEKILADLARSRSEITRNTQAVRGELDVKAKANTVIRRNPWAWLGGAAALGWILAGPKTRTKTRTITRTAKPGEKAARTEKKTAARTGLLAGLIALIRLLFPVMKPFLSSYATKFMAEVAGRAMR